MIVDTSAMIAWLVAERETPVVEPYLDPPGEIIAPDLMMAEVANGLWRKHWRGLVSADEVPGLLAAAERRVTRFVPSGELAVRAVQLAIARDHAAYDAFFVTLAERERLPLITCDQLLAEKFADDAEIVLLKASAPAAPPPPAPPGSSARSRKR